MLARLADAPFSYPEVGATAGALPAGYRHVHRLSRVGSGDAAYALAAERLITFQMHRRAGFAVEATQPRAAPGTVVLQRLRLGPVRLDAACRVVAVRDDERATGFTYGTLGGHPERGEEQFLVELLSDATVVFSVTAFSRADRWFTRAAGPVGHVVQDLLLRRYARALRSS